jgi:hypothetical protein
MSEIPANKKLWEMIIAQAKARYSNYPNPGASNWVHQQYVKHGGHFIKRDENTRKKILLSRQFQAKRKARLEAMREAEKKHHGKDNKDK